MSNARHPQHTVLRNIYSFLDVLQSFHNNEVKSLTLQTVQDAMQWAKYCEKVSLQARGKDYWDDLNSHVVQIGKLPWTIGDQEINLMALQDAPVIMAKMILQNTQLGVEEMKSVLMHFVEEDNKPSQKITILLSDMVQLFGSAKYASAITQHLSRSEQGPGEWGNIPDEAAKSSSFCMEAGITFIMNFITNILEHNKLTYAEQKLRVISKSQFGLDILVNTLICRNADDTIGYKKQCSNLVLSRLVEEANSLNSIIWAVDKSSLSVLSSKHLPFFKLYIRYLVYQTKRLNSENTTDPLYADIEAHWISLLAAEPRISAASRSALQFTARLVPGGTAEIMLRDIH